MYELLTMLDNFQSNPMAKIGCGLESAHDRVNYLCKLYQYEEHWQCFLIVWGLKNDLVKCNQELHGVVVEECETLNMKEGMDQYASSSWLVHVA